MPVTITKNPGGGYKVATPNGVHAKNTSLAKNLAILSTIEWLHQLLEKTSSKKAKVKLRSQEKKHRNSIHPITISSPKFLKDGGRRLNIK